MEAEAKPYTLGYVGVGLMGLPMVQRLLKLGWRVRAYDIVAERIARSGALPCGSASEAARDADLVLLNLPTNDAVVEAVFGDQGLAKTLRPPQLVVDFSTIPVEACRTHAVRVEKQTGCRWVDAPVSGGPVDAARIPECLAGGYADSNLMKAYWPRMVERDFAPRGYVRQLLKDLEMVSKWAGGLEATTPMLTQALCLYRELAKRGHTDLDTSAIRKLYD